MTRIEYTNTMAYEFHPERNGAKYKIRNARTVERMHQLRLAVRVAEAAVQAARLIIGEARARRHLQPLLLAGSPQLEIVALGCGKAHVAAAELKNAVVQPKSLEDRLSLADENLQLLEARIGMDEIHHLDLVELVDSQHAARHFAGASRLAAETRRVCRKLDGQILGLENVVAVEVRDRHLGRRNQPEIVDLAMVEILGKLRKLAGSGHRRGIDYERRKHFGVALLLAMHIQHVLDQRTLKLGALAKENRETRTRELHAARKVEDAQLLADGDVIENLIGGIVPFADSAHDDIRFAVHAGGDLLGRDVGNHQQRIAQTGFDCGEFAVDLGDAVAHLAHLLLGGRDVAAFLGDLADLLRRGIPLSLERFRLGDKRAARFVKAFRLFQNLNPDAAPRQGGRRRFKIIPQFLDVYHVSFLRFRRVSLEMALI